MEEEERRREEGTEGFNLDGFGGYFQSHAELPPDSLPSQVACPGGPVRLARRIARASTADAA